jgi:hypothetical protein
MDVDAMLAKTLLADMGVTGPNGSALVPAGVLTADKLKQVAGDGGKGVGAEELRM